MSLKIIEISKGAKPAGNVMKFGGSPEYDYYIKSYGSVSGAKSSDITYFFDKAAKIMKRRYFEFAKGAQDFNDKINGF